MKRRDLERHLRDHGCLPRREGGKHSGWQNPANGRKSVIPRSREINDFTARGICKQLGVPSP